MDRIRIRGGARLEGAIPISGAKNAALPLMAACLLTHEPLVLANVPELADIAFMAELLRSFGVEATRNEGAFTLSAARIRDTTAAYDLVRKMRASFLVLGPLLARWGEAKVSLPGGCAIGARPVDLHIRALLALGARYRAPRRLCGGERPRPAARRAHRISASFSRRHRACDDGGGARPRRKRDRECGAGAGDRRSRPVPPGDGRASHGLGTSRIEIEGVETLHGADYRVLPDRIETGTYAIAVAVTEGQVELLDTDVELIGSRRPAARTDRG